MKNLLIISNNVFSENDNNGKTLYNLIKNISKFKVSQLYFNKAMPTIKGYNYYQITDLDIILSRYNSKKKGRIINTTNDTLDLMENKSSNSLHIIKNLFTIIIREILWKNSWKSEQLLRWLDDVRPDAIFFLAGDCIFAYDICNFIKDKYQCKLFTYVTDDYVLERKNELFFYHIYRNIIKNKLINCLSKTYIFFTICDRMKTTYKRIFGRDSIVLINRTENLFDKMYWDISKNNKEYIFLYVGNLYYGRELILLKLANSIKKYNDKFVCNNKKAKLHIYTYSFIKQSIFKKFINTGVVSIHDGISFSNLKIILNSCNFLVFVESFDKKEIEKTKLSFSTKIIEYLSLRKPILAIGPRDIGSMDCLSKAAICVYDLNNLQNVINSLLMSDDFSVCINNALVEYNKLINTDTLDKYLINVSEGIINNESFAD